MPSREEFQQIISSETARLKDEIKDALREVLAEADTYVMAVEGRQYLCDEGLRIASYIPDPTSLSKLAAMYGTRPAMPTGEFRAAFVVDDK